MKNLFFMLIVLVIGGCMNSSKKKSMEEQEAMRVADSVMTVSGQLVIGHEVRSFMPDGDTLIYWLIDRSGTLKAMYDSAVGIDASPYTPVKAELKIIDRGPSDDGFSADYDGVYEVIEIVGMEKMVEEVQS